MLKKHTLVYYMTEPIYVGLLQTFVQAPDDAFSNNVWPEDFVVSWNVFIG